MANSSSSKSQSRYKALIEKIFFDHYKENDTLIEFERNELESAAKLLEITLPKNLGDVIYSIRYRTPMPESILSIQPKDMEWIIIGVGRSRYAFKLVRLNRIAPNPDLAVTKIPDATPEIISNYSLSDEQALLAKVRYNRLIDIFLGISVYSLQNHLRTTVKDIGQIEIDEVYVGIDKQGNHYIIPVQAKTGNDQLSVVQTKQDVDCCSEKFQNLICRAISTQFMEDDLIAIFELTVEDDEVRIIEERHYKLVPAKEITSHDLQKYKYRN
ncbi:hypothetical protein [Thiohalophilus sp.]|uniref:hypothetical protein n=1 Tax=Thiohalophilus sp. TaxID=3028392 RepID=UPI002ACEC06F|nr:hypothetical protein [Thiohalophilus sp.]MDZ7661650.1 hypothetical protein [Thiohalophilus sp.]